MTTPLQGQKRHNMRFPWFFLLLICCTSASLVEIDNEALKNAVKLLESVGVENLCHLNMDEEPFPFLSPCNDSVHRHLDQQQELEVILQSAWFDVWNIFGAFVCVGVSAIAAGLTVSLLSLDPLILLIKMRASENPVERKQAARLVTIVQRRHPLLVSLILCSAISSEALPIFLQDLMPRFAAVFVAVVLVVVFGEVLPTIIFTGPNQIAIASRWTPFVKVIMCILCPIAAPIAAILDHVQHGQFYDQGNKYNRGELAALIRIQYEERMAFQQRKRKDLNNATRKNESQSSQQMEASLRALKGEFNRNFPEDDGSKAFAKPSLSINSEEIAMVEGALQMKSKIAMDIFVPLNKVFSIPSDMVLDEPNVVKIYGSAYSRIPVYERKQQDEQDKSGIIGIFHSRQLIMVKPDCELTISNLRMHVPYCISPKLNLVDVMNVFQGGGDSGKGGHMVIVCARPEVGNKALDRGEAIPPEAIVMGIITLEDVLEALLQEQIYDEMDAEAGRGTAIAEEEMTDEGEDFDYGIML